MPDTDTPEREIIEYLESAVLPEFTLNTDLLHDWQTELSDIAADQRLLADATRHEIVISFPPGPVYFSESHKKAIQRLFQDLASLDVELYSDFILAVHEVVFCAATALAAGKVQLYRGGLLGFLIDDFVTYACSLKDDASDSQRHVCGAKSQILGAFLQLGCDAKKFKRLLFPVLTRSSQVCFTAKKLVLNTLFSFLETCPTQLSTLTFTNFVARPVTIPINPDCTFSKRFTISTWFRLNELARSAQNTDQLIPLTLLSLANSADRDSLVFQVQLLDSKFTVTILSTTNRSKRQFTFNHVLSNHSSSNQGLTHLVLTYDAYQNLNLYVDGQYCESIPCSAISKAEIQWNKLYVGDPSEPSERDELGANIFTKHELIVKDLAVLDISLKFEWISLFYLLGVGFDWAQKEFAEQNVLAFLDCLSQENYIHMSYRTQEISNSRSQQQPYRNNVQSGNRASQKPGPSASLVSKKDIAQLLMKSKISASNFLFDVNDSQFIEFIDSAKSQEILYHRYDSFCNAVYCWGGSGLLLSLIDAVMRDEYCEETQRHFLFFKSVALLLSCLKSDWRINKEFENIDGYWNLTLLINSYKVNYNPDLVFKQSPKLEDQHDVGDGEFHGESIVRMLIDFSCSSSGSGLFVSNPLAFKTLVLNFDLVSAENISSIHSCITGLFASEKHKNLNFREISRMKVLKKLLQQMRMSILEGGGERKLDELINLLSIFINFDVSVDSIKHVSQFVIFALYDESADEASQNVGLQVLLVLTNKLCGPSSSMKSLKKFSRSISIHWILLLLDFEGENKPISAKVVCCAIGLLSKFLRVLGPHVIKRFFQANRGLSVLSYFLQHWWSDDRVVSTLFMNSFGVDNDAYDASLPSLPELVRDHSVTNGTNTVMIPDLVTLLNNLALTGVIQLGQKQGKVMSTPSSPIKSLSTKTSSHDQIAELFFDTIHLLNQMADMIEVGFSDSKALQELFCSKEWLEGAFEIIAHLKILKETSHPTPQVNANFRKCVDRYVAAITSIFVSMLLDAKKLLTIMKSLRDMTKKLMLDAIFPKIFEHINGFLGNTNFIFKEVDFVRGAAEILGVYYNEFVLQNYSISKHELNEFMTCLVAIVETKDANSSLRDQLGPILGNTLVMQLSSVSHVTSENVDLDESLENDFAKELDENVKFCLYKQGLILQSSVLNDTNLRSTIELIMGNFLKLSFDKQIELSGHVLNFLRSAIVMRENEFSAILTQLTRVSDYQNSGDILSDFFSFLTTHNDEETVRYIQKFPTIRHIFNKNFHFRLSKLGSVGQNSVLDMVQVVLNSSGTLGFMNNAQLQGFEKDCQMLKSITIAGEQMKYNRELQDMEENIRFYLSAYGTLKLDVQRLLKESPMTNVDLVLDYIEGADRMRMLLVGEDQLPESEKLSYAMKVPMKQINPSEIQNHSNPNLDSVFSAFGIQNLAISESPGLDMDLNEYEDIDENGESTSSARTSSEDRNRKVLRSLYLGDQIQALFNISRVSGLDAVESLMILGYSHIYFIDNFFHCADGNVVDIEEAPQESRDPYLQFIKPKQEDPKCTKNYRTKAWSLASLACVCKRKFLLRDIALELFFDDGASLLITCLSTKQRDNVHGKLSPYLSGESLDKDLQVTLEVSSSSSQLAQSASSSGFHFKSRLVSAFSGGLTNGSSFSEITKKWKMGKISNFYYLMCINTMAGRTFNDLTQYPVFPWVIADYDSAELDLNDPKSFRDLSKPMGAQTTKRAEEYRERYEALESLNDGNSPPFHYGTHYSSAMIVTSYLIRLKPYVQSYLLLQGGKFDHADRLFNSVGKAWSSASKDNTTDVRELTPEFFYLPEFLENKNNFEFGKLQGGGSSNDVALPKWAKGDPKIFISKNREALESAHVSANLNHWIDLVFGYKQNGEEAVKALNVFHHSSYDGAINLDHINDDIEKRAVIGMINNFGQTPIKLFTKAHTTREILNLPYLQLSLDDANRKPPTCTFESKLRLPLEKLEVSAKSRKWIGRPPCTSSEDQILIRKPSPGIHKHGNGSLFINTTLFMNLHSTNITALLQIGNKFFMTGAEDGIIHVWKCSLQPSLSVSFHAVLRGHLATIRSFCYSKTFKVCFSVDADGAIIQWDIARYKFVRRIANPSPHENSKVLMAISNDTGNFCTVQSTRYHNMLTVFTLNGEKITSLALKPGRITAITLAQANDSLVESLKTEFRHSYWNEELVLVSYASPQVSLQIYNLRVDRQGWVLNLLQSAELKSLISGHVTVMQTFKQTEVCEVEKICRGRLALVLGDSTGRVYVW